MIRLTVANLRVFFCTPILTKFESEEQTRLRLHERHSQVGVLRATKYLSILRESEAKHFRVLLAQYAQGRLSFACFAPDRAKSRRMQNLKRTRSRPKVIHPFTTFDTQPQSTLQDARFPTIPAIRLHNSSALSSPAFYFRNAYDLFGGQIASPTPCVAISLG